MDRVDELEAGSTGISGGILWPGEAVELHNTPFPDDGLVDEATERAPLP